MNKIVIIQFLFQNSVYGKSEISNLLKSVRNRVRKSENVVVERARLGMCGRQLEVKDIQIQLESRVNRYSYINKKIDS